MEGARSANKRKTKEKTNKFLGKILKNIFNKIQKRFEKSTQLCYNIGYMTFHPTERKEMPFSEPERYGGL